MNFLWLPHVFKLVINPKFTETITHPPMSGNISPGSQQVNNIIYFVNPEPLSSLDDVMLDKVPFHNTGMTGVSYFIDH